MNKPIKVIFAGTPEFAVPYLQGIFSAKEFEVVGIITQPDKPTGRKQTLTPPPIKFEAQNFDVKIWQPEKLRTDQNILEEIKATSADILVVVAYGQIIPKTILDLFPGGCFNVHPSLLPKYRGASPIQNAILHGDTETGITIMLMDDQMDHGPILKQLKVELTGDETNESLHQDMAELGVPLLLSTTKDYLTGKITPQAQNEAEATFCKLITTADAQIDWSQPASEIKNKIHAFYPWPATWTTVSGKRLKIFPPISLTVDFAPASPGKVAILDNGFTVQCGQGAIIIDELQPEGKKLMRAKDYINGLQAKDQIQLV